MFYLKKVTVRNMKFMKQEKANSLKTISVK